MMHQESLFDCCPDAPRIQKVVTDGVWVILVDGRVGFTFQETETYISRHAALTIVENGWAEKRKVAKLWDITVRCLDMWLENYRSNGSAGLIGTVGRPIKISDTTQRRIRSLKAEGHKVAEIMEILKLSSGAVCRALYTAAPVAEETQPELPAFDAGSIDAEAEETGIVDDDTALNELVETSCNEHFIEKSPANESAVAEAIPVGRAAPAVIDPLDRSTDRAMARMGLLDDADPVFADSPHVEYAGTLLAVAALASGDFLEHVHRLYRTFGGAFYGVRTIFMTLFLMAVGRIRNPEQLNGLHTLELGRLLGLDRSPSVKTLRVKIKALCGRGQAGALMTSCARSRIEAGSQVDEIALLIDGHVYVYNGDAKVGKTFSTSRNRVVKGTTDYWVNLPDGTPLLCIPTSFNEHLNKMLPTIVAAAQKLCPGRRITVIFDRGGADAVAYEAIIKLGVDIIAYNHSSKPVDHTLFKEVKTTINGKEYAHAPLERDIEIPVYEKSGKARTDTGRRLAFREFIVLRADGKTTPVITTHKERQAIPVLEAIFSRWTQENFFKHFDYAYDFNHLAVYAKTKLPEGGDHPNPEYLALQKQQKRLRDAVARLLQRKFTPSEYADPDAVSKRFAKKLNNKQRTQLAALCQALKTVHEALATTPEKEPTDDFVKLDAESRLLLNQIKAEAYCAEGALAKFIGKRWLGINGNERGMIVAMMQTTGSLKTEPGILRVTLRKQATPERTRLLKLLCAEMSAKAAVYPGTGLAMHFSVGN